MILKDSVDVTDRGTANLIDKSGSIVAGREWGNEKSVVEVNGWVSMCLRERGKIVPGSKREGHNIWTNTGREFLAMLMSIKTNPNTPWRNDHIGYVGVGTGLRVEEASILSLANPIEYVVGLFLADLDVVQDTDFPLRPSRTSVRFHRLFTETEITIAPGVPVLISEIGMFTNGRASDYEPGLRDRSIANASVQAPCAYRAFEPLGKTDSIQLEVFWEVRF